MRTFARAALALLASAVVGACASATERPLLDGEQLVLVTIAGWDANQGVLFAFEREAGSWRRMQGPIPVSIGRAGAAWGLGLHPPQASPIKQEGDGRSPAGLFRIGVAFGYDAATRTSLRYRPLQPTDHCIDVSGSPLYNQIVDASIVGEAAVAGSTERMRLDLHNDGDVRYKLGFVVEHNATAAPQAGSCIFAHLWRAAGEPTSGCTAMDETAMRALLAWLDPKRRPVFALLPQSEYSQKESEWGLPDL